MQTILGYVADAIAEGARSDEHAVELWGEVRAELEAAGVDGAGDLVLGLVAPYRVLTPRSDDACF